jgi:hypothetical protein
MTNGGVFVIEVLSDHSLSAVVGGASKDAAADARANAVIDRALNSRPAPAATADPLNAAIDGALSGRAARTANPVAPPDVTGMPCIDTAFGKMCSHGFR